MTSTDAQAQIVSVLKGELQALKRKYPGYSLRRFSKKLGVPSPILSEVLNGKRRVTKKLATQLLIALPIETELKHGLIEALPAQRSRKSEPGDHRVALSAAEFQIISDWWHFAILALLDSGVKIQGADDLGRFFPVSVPKLRRAIENLKSLGLVFEEEGRLRSTGKEFTTTHNVSDIHIQSNHAQGLDLAREAIFEVPVSDRDFSSITVPFDLADMDEVRAEIRQFRRRLSERMEKSKGQEVYRLQIQLFPLTKTRRDESENG